MPKTTIRCVCGAWISVEGHGNDTVLAKKRFIDDHRECREKLDAEIKSKINCESACTVRVTMQ